MTYLAAREQLGRDPSILRHLVLYRLRGQDAVYHDFPLLFRPLLQFALKILIPLRFDPHHVAAGVDAQVLDVELLLVAPGLFAPRSGQAL